MKNNQLDRMVSGGLNEYSTERLPDTLKANGHEYVLHKREGNHAIYEQHHPLGGLIAYEVIVVNVREPRTARIKRDNGTVFEKDYPRMEVYPTTSQWGKYGWTYTKLENAEKKFRGLREKATGSKRQGEETQRTVSPIPVG